MERDKEFGSKLLDEVRNMSISRRGGVRTRGGRLPPIRSRDLPKLAESSIMSMASNTPQRRTIKDGKLPTAMKGVLKLVKSSKKVIAPNIPQRRMIKEEVRCEESTPLIKEEPQQEARRTRRPKVFLQTGGSFLSEGPAAKVKREPVEDPCYAGPSRRHISPYESGFSKVDPETIKELLNYYEACEAYDDEFDVLPPYRLPLLPRDGLITKINADTSKIKVHPTEVTNETIKIKIEPVDEPTEVEFEPDKIKSKPIDKSEIKTEDVPLHKADKKVFEKDVKNDFEDFCNTKDEGMLILLHWPNHFPWNSDQIEGDIKTDTKTPEVVHVPTFIDKLPAGKIGKLQFMKSGKKRLVMGEHVFAFEEGAESESSKEIVSIKITDQGGDLAVMGKIDRTMVIRPIVENIL